MNILLVDNDRAFLRSLEIVLSGFGHRVVACDNPREASRLIRTEACPDALLIDMVMPEMSGLELLQEIGSYLSPDVKVILISGHTDHLGPETLDGTAVTAFLPKPLDLQQLDDILSIHSTSRSA